MAEVLNNASFRKNRKSDEFLDRRRAGKYAFLAVQFNGGKWTN